MQMLIQVKPMFLFSFNQAFPVLNSFGHPTFIMVLFSTYQFPLSGCPAKVTLCFHGDCPMAEAISVAEEASFTKGLEFQHKDLDLDATLTARLCTEQCSIPSGVCDCTCTDPCAGVVCQHALQ